MKQNMVKKVLACLLTATMTVGLSACGGSDGNNSGDAGRISSDQVKEDNQAADDGSSDSKDTTESTKKTEISADNHDLWPGWRRVHDDL